MATALPAALLAPTLVPATYLMFIYPMLFVPTMYGLRQSSQAGVKSMQMIQKMYLYENGEQILLQTHNGVLHKLDIIHNDQHFFEEGKNGELIFSFTNGDRQYGISNHEATLLDYDFIDRIVKSICIDTRRRRDVYHRQISRQLPNNLKPEEYNKYLPAWNTNFKNLNSSAFLWRLSNRTIYRQAYMAEDAPTAEIKRKFLHHLRNKTRVFNPTEQALKDEFNLKIVYPEQLFYDTHRISQKDFLDSLREAKQSGDTDKVEQLIIKLFTDETKCGRRGVKTLKDTYDLLAKKEQNKERMSQFALKISNNEEGMSFKQLRESGIFKNYA